MLHWMVSGEVTSCTAGGDWHGDKSTASSNRESTGSLSTEKTYTLQCFGPNGNTPIRTVSIDIGTTSSEDGACGSANGSSSVSQPSANLCSIGTITSSGVINNSSTNKWEWSCSGVGSGATSPLCSAKKGKKPTYTEY